jgi:hypothetical protein
MWQQTWFYCTDVVMPDGDIGLPPYTPGCLVKLPRWNPKLTKEELEEAQLLVNTINTLQQRGLVGNDLSAAWVSHRVQPLQARERPMYPYRGIDNPTRVNPRELSQDKFQEKMRHLTMVRHNLRMEGSVPPFGATLLPQRVCSD